MQRIVGIVFGLVYVGLVTLAFRHSAAGWADGYPDLGFWWAVIGSFLTIAGLVAVVGTFIHASQTRG